MAIPSLLRARLISQGVVVANDLRLFGGAFAMYAIDHGTYPPDSHETLPSVPQIEEYIDAVKFNSITVFGGRYNYEGPDFYPYAGVSVSGSVMSQADLLKIDAVVDDGSLTTGRYIRSDSGQFTYIIE